MFHKIKRKCRATTILLGAGFAISMIPNCITGLRMLGTIFTFAENHIRQIQNRFGKGSFHEMYDETMAVSDAQDLSAALNSKILEY